MAFVIIIILVILIIYTLYKQNFVSYTSGAEQRYKVEFSGTNQQPYLPDDTENFVDWENYNRELASNLSNSIKGFISGNVNRFADAKHKVHHNSQKSMELENKLFDQTHIPLNL